MSRLVALTFTVSLLAAPAALAADPPKFSEGGFIFSIQYGAGFWDIDEAPLAAQVDPTIANVFVGDLKTAQALTLKMQYVILGHASVGIDFTGTGWDVFSQSRGGAGFLAGTLAWHPLEAIFKLMKYEERPVRIDVSTYGGLGYGIAGQRVGSDGLVAEWGLEFDWYFTRFFALGTFVRGVFPLWKQLYLDFNNRDVPGNTLPLADGVGGAFWTVGLSVNLRAGD